MSDKDQIEIIPDEPQYDHTQAPHWLLLATHLKPHSIHLYLLLRAHVNTTRRRSGDTTVWPSLDVLAEQMNLSQGRRLLPYMKQLEESRLVGIERTKTGMKTRNVYRVRMNPPPGWDGPLSLTDFYADRHVNNPVDNHKSAGHTVVPKTAPRSAHFGTSVVPISAPELNEFELDEKSPPPTSSSNGSAPATQDRIEEEEVDQDVKAKIDSLPWYGREPTLTQLRQLARKTKPLLEKGAVWAVLRAALVASTHSGVRDIVALYLHRLQEIQLEDVSRPPVERPSRSRQGSKPTPGVPVHTPAGSGPSTAVLDRSTVGGHGTWCGECQRITRRTIDGAAWCPKCSAHALRESKVLNA